MSDLFIADIFYFQNSKNITIFNKASNQTFYRYVRIYKIHDIEYSACISHIQQKHVHPFSIFYNSSIFSFLSLCVSKCAARKYSIFIVNPVYKEVMRQFQLKMIQ